MTTKCKTCGTEDFDYRNDGDCCDDPQPIDLDDLGFFVSAFYSHDWVTFDGVNYNCSVCDCKPWHQAARRQCMS